MSVEKIKKVSKRFDYLGIVTGSAAIILLLIPKFEGGSYFNWELPMVTPVLVVGGC